MKIMCKLLGGSKSYGLSTPSSDTDYRGVFLNTTLSDILGMTKMEHFEDPTEEDTKYKELRHFFKLLKSGNPETVEMMFIDGLDDNAGEYRGDMFYLIQTHRYELIDTEAIYRCLRGYMQGELKLANGERTGALGGKRKEALDQYGFSPKNFVQLLRLCWAGYYYFKRGIFPVYMPIYDFQLTTDLIDIKTNPQNYTKEQLNERVCEFRERFENSYKERTVDHHYNTDLANSLILETYFPLIKDKLPKK